MTSPKLTASRKYTHKIYVCKPLRQSKRKSSTFTYLTLAQKIAIMKACSDSALILYEYYLSRSGLDDYGFEDAKVARSLEWDESKVRRIRRQLTRQHYFYQTKSTDPNGVRTVVTHLDHDRIVKIMEKIAAASSKPVQNQQSIANSATTAAPVSP